MRVCFNPKLARELQRRIDACAAANPHLEGSALEEKLRECRDAYYRELRTKSGMGVHPAFQGNQ